jgi:hypothetical protein
MFGAFGIAALAFAALAMAAKLRASGRRAAPRAGSTRAGGVSPDVLKAATGPFWGRGSFQPLPGSPYSQRKRRKLERRCA